MKKYNKKGDMWISVAIYMALSVVVLTVILAAGNPILAKMRAKNTFTQTKDIMNNINDMIRQVASESAGSQMPASVNIKEGELKILGYNSTIAGNSENNSLIWTFDSKNNLGIEPGLWVKEGALLLHADKISEDSYKLKIKLDYSDRAIIITEDSIPKIAKTNILVSNEGYRAYFDEIDSKSGIIIKISSPQ